MFTLGLILGILLTGIACVISLWSLAFSKHSNYEMIDVWWTETAERWEGLRQVILSERSNG